MGWLHQVTHNYIAGLASVAVSLGLGAFAVARLCRPDDAEAKNGAEKQMVG
jgi:hypothetical protein